MKPSSPTHRRPKLQITLARASRLYRLVGLLADGADSREGILQGLKVGLRTFYRELELLKKCGVKVKQAGKVYQLHTKDKEEAQGRLPFPDPQLSFAEMTELSNYGGPASKRMGKLLESVVGENARGQTGRKGQGKPSRTSPKARGKK